MSTLREIQLCGLEILNAVDELCQKHNLVYHLNWGTLLGAIRHQGFIPWDNDIDISMPISDYRRFLQIAQKELKEGLFLQTYRTDRGYNEMWANVRADGTTSMPVSWKKYSIHRGISIDIFPMVGWAKSAMGQRIQRRAFQLCRMLLAKEYMLAINSPELIYPSWKLRLVLSIPWRVRIMMCSVLELIVFRRIRQEGQVAIVGTGLRGSEPAEAYAPGKSAVFENNSYPIPKDWDSVLTHFYGDYMTPPPPEKRGYGHELLFGSIIYDCEKDYRDYL